MYASLATHNPHAGQRCLGSSTTWIMPNWQVQTRRARAAPTLSWYTVPANRRLV
jgi:hypothetical protein